MLKLTYDKAKEGMCQTCRNSFFGVDGNEVAKKWSEHNDLAHKDLLRKGKRIRLIMKEE